MTRAILTFRCTDRPGIVADVAGWVRDSAGNIDDAAHHHDTASGQFASRFSFTHPHDLTELRGSFEQEVAVPHRMHWDLRAPGRARLGVLASRQGHCLYDLAARCATGDLDADIAVVISNHPDLGDVAAAFGLDFAHLPTDEFSRTDHDRAVDRTLRDHEVELVVCARYMRVLGEEFCREHAERAINVHHSFLPAFVGAGAYRQAWERGVKMIGATAHYITEQLDAGPIIAQATRPVTHDDDPERLARKGRDLETSVLADAVRAHIEQRIITIGARTVVFT